MAHREQRLADTITYLELVKEKHSSYIATAMQMHEQFESAAKNGKLNGVQIERKFRDENGHEIDPSVIQNYLVSAMAASSSSHQFKLHNCGPNSATVSAEMTTNITVKMQDGEVSVETDPRLDYYQRQIALVKSMQKKN